eukprot:GGOE01017804.1.p1 GENE.GGOE01017804.1~~GGOE01017804.1.p1  ORF type:complete len:925 (+),score=282.78 GGOE01017804.1:45-2819(+)
MQPVALLQDGDAQQQTINAQEVLRLFETKDEAIQQLETALADCEARLQRTEEGWRREQQAHRIQYTQLAHEKKMVVEELKDAVRRSTAVEAELLACRQQQQTANLFAPLAPPRPDHSGELLALRKANSELQQQLEGQTAAKGQVQALQGKLAALVQKVSQLEYNHQELQAQLSAREEELLHAQEEAAIAVGGLRDALHVEESRSSKLMASLGWCRAELQCAEQLIPLVEEEWEGRVLLLGAFLQHTAQVRAQEGQAWHAHALAAERKTQRLVALMKRSAEECLAKDNANGELRQQCEAKEEEVQRLRDQLRHWEEDCTTVRQQLAAARDHSQTLDNEQLRLSEECAQLQRAIKDRSAECERTSHEVKRLLVSNVELQRNIQHLEQECKLLAEDSRLQVESKLRAEAKAQECARAREDAGKQAEQLRAELVTAQSALAVAQAVVARVQAEASAHQSCAAAALGKNCLLEKQARETRALVAKLKLGQLRMQEKVREGDEARVAEALRQGEQMAELLQQLAEDRERLAQQLAAEQGEGRAEAERMRQEIEKLSSHHADALQLAAEQQQQTQRRLQEDASLLATVRAEADRLAGENLQLRNRATALEARCQQLSTELKNSRACYAQLSTDLATAQREAQQEQRQWSQRMEALQAQVHREEEWAGVHRQLQEGREQCRAAKEDCLRKGKAVEALKMDRDACQASSRKSAEALAAAEAREKQTRKDMARMMQSLTDLRAKVIAADGRAREHLDAITRLEAQLEAAGKEKETRDALLKATRSATQHRLVRLHSQLAQVVTWLVRQTEDTHQEVQRRRQRLKAVRTDKDLQAVQEAVYQNAGLLSQSLFSLNLGEILHGPDESDPSVARVSILEGCLQRLAAAVEGKPSNTDPPTAQLQQEGADLPALFYQLVEMRVQLEHALAQLAGSVDA